MSHHGVWVPGLLLDPLGPLRALPTEQLLGGVADGAVVVGGALTCTYRVYTHEFPTFKIV